MTWTPRTGVVVDCRSRDGWLSRRRIGSSDVAKILGLSSFGTGFDVWTRLSGRARPRAPQTEDQTRGHEWERTALLAYGEQTETIREVLAPGPYDLHVGPEAWATATPDGYARDEFAGWGLVEAKTDRHAGGKWGESGDVPEWNAAAAERVRPDYAVQVYHQLWVTGAPWCDLVVLGPFYDLRRYRIWRDPLVEEQLLEALREWVRRYLVEDVPPPLDGSDAATEYLSDRFRLSTAGTRPATVGEVHLATLYNAAGESIRVAESTRKQAAQLLLGAIGHGTGLTIGDTGKVSVVRPSPRRRLKEKRLREERPELVEILDEYTETTEVNASIRVTFRNPKTGESSHE